MVYNSMRSLSKKNRNEELCFPGLLSFKNWILHKRDVSPHAARAAQTRKATTHPARTHASEQSNKAVVRESLPCQAANNNNSHLEVADILYS